MSQATQHKVVANGRSRRVTTPEIRENMARMREAGCTIKVIAEVVGFSISTVDWWLLKLCVDSPRSPRHRSETLRAYVRHNHAVNPFVPHEDAVLVALEKQGLTYGKISRAMTMQFPDRPRSRNTVLARLMILARREERSLAR